MPEPIEEKKKKKKKKKRRKMDGCLLGHASFLVSLIRRIVMIVTIGKRVIICI